MINLIRLKIREFFKKYKTMIIIALSIWAIVLVINYILGRMPEVELVPITDYEPHIAVMDKSEVPQKLRYPIEEKISEFIKYCNEKEYEKAYELLSEDCRKNLYPKMDDFKIYVNLIFTTKKICNIQNFSNKDGNYIYTVTIIDDIMATGSTGLEKIEEYEETFVMKEEDGEIKLSIRGYIGNEKIDKMYEDDYLKITIDDSKVEYETITYSVKIKNKTDYIIVLEDSSQKYEVVLDINGEYRRRKGIFLDSILLYPDETKTFELKYTKFYDEKGKINNIIFYDIRILKSYTGTEETRQDEIKNGIARYSVSIKMEE